MSLLIKNTPLPTTCLECPCCRHDSMDGLQAHQCNLTLDMVGDQGGRASNCPLIEVRYGNERSKSEREGER